MKVWWARCIGFEIVPDRLDIIEFGRYLGSHSTVSQWARAARAASERLLAVDRRRCPRPARPAWRGGLALEAATIERVVNMTLNEKPAGGTHWSLRKMAKAVRLSHSSVQRIWAAHGLKPHLTRSFKLSNDPKFCEKVQDIVGLYLDPPDKALVLSVDEKSQIRGARSHPAGTAVEEGPRPRTMTHDYKRHGTTTLFAALDVATGKVIGECMSRHRHQEFLRFLRTIDRNAPKQFDLHLIVDNYATHKHAKVKAWLKRHPRFHLHFTPTSASWINLVERFFGLITGDAIRRGVFRSVAEPQDRNRCSLLAATRRLSRHATAPANLAARQRHPCKSLSVGQPTGIWTLA